MKQKTRIIAILIILLGGFFRFYGLNWDQGTHLHPDERFLTMVATAIEIPKSIGEYLDPNRSPMNPYNKNYGFFVYGAFPLNLTKVVGQVVKMTTYDNIHFVGRRLSGFFDLAIVLVTFLIVRKIWSEKAALWAAFVYSSMVLPIQLSHFFVVDTFLNFFIILTFWWLIKLFTDSGDKQGGAIFPYSILMGVSFGLALACKISAVYFLPIIGLGYCFRLIQKIKEKKAKPALSIVVSGLLFGIIAGVFFRIGDPRVFSNNNYLDWKINPKLSQNWNELKSYTSPETTSPPSLQWKSKKPILFPLGNMMVWGMGLPLGLLALGGWVYVLCSIKQKNTGGIKRERWLLFLVCLWIVALFIYQGSQFVTSMRYFLVIYPFLAITSGIGIEYLSTKLVKNRYLAMLILSMIIIYPISFMSVYTHKLTRVQASEWIYNTIPSGTKVLNEEWDDGLPVGIPGKSSQYEWVTLFMYDEDTPAKSNRINEAVAKVDYIFLSSNRAWESTTRLPKLYPATTAYYQSLFNQTGGFSKAAEFTSRPCFPPWLPSNKQWFCYNDDDAEENFTVFDHPKVMIFKRK